MTRSLVVAEPELAERVALAGRVLGKLDATHGSFGHVSVRTGPNSMLIKGKGPGEVSLRHTTASDVIAVSFDVQKLDGRDDLRPPSESFLHAWIYRLRPEPEDELAEIARPPGPDRPFGSSGGLTGVLATWNNYQHLAEES